MIGLLLALSTIPACLPDNRLDAVVASIEAAGGEMIDLVDVPGEHADQLLVFVLSSTVAVGAFKDGCAVAGPMPLDQAVEKKGTPA